MLLWSWFNTLKYIPNIITILRILLIAPIIWLIWKESYYEALVLVIIAGVSDGVDGFLARYFHWQTPSGAVLDPLADKILLISLFVVFGLKELIPLWLVAIVILRDIIILAGATAYHFVTKNLEMRPILVSKVNTFLQIGLMILVSLQLAQFAIPAWFHDAMIVLVAVSTLLSGFSYMFLWSKYTYENKK
ncbi:MAG: CDP-diacylglycerol--glycerol-3-phosphate 3-phosphatidyltransferase (EC [uncultured Thiotrichaceae bacterium]|uniref:CDP-diacylglycerol--glycerol-3-phosphate 3-phosphatidyltransferase n=1 Tax=uncultured Thiotrichaceae bacterium TaxID=298394 RepID=A0A6S6U6P2_9GAMM|nr:MAG: CDP-diacylglycerol--glycerol-3-phosphate 3-phosphatidyltransferase (EC [uncultured Thiotrichaceae bacterium]